MTKIANGANLTKAEAAVAVAPVIIDGESGIDDVAKAIIFFLKPTRNRGTPLVLIGGRKKVAVKPPAVGYLFGNNPITFFRK